MGIFREILKPNESLFRDSVPLDFDHIPKILKYREKEQRQFAFAIKPLLQKRNGRNLFVYGAPGIGKTVACRHVLRELEEETESVAPLYINCWKNNSAFKIAAELCSQLGLRLVQNQKTAEIFQKANSCLNKKEGAVFVFDEIDKLEDFSMIYMILEEVYRKSIILITNYKNKVEALDERIMSRLNPDFVEFLPYNEAETRGILLERMKYAFAPGVWDESAFSIVAGKAAEMGDIRKGLFLLREAGNIAEENASRKIAVEHAKKAVEKADNFQVNEYDSLGDELRDILGFVKENEGLKMGDLFQNFQKSGKEMSYKTFTRKISKLDEAKFLRTEKTTGKEGNTRKVYLYGKKKSAGS